MLMSVDGMCRVVGMCECGGRVWEWKEWCICGGYGSVCVEGGGGEVCMCGCMTERSNFPITGNDTSCIPCLSGKDRPNPMEFERYLAWFLNDTPTQECAAGGRAAFKSAVLLNKGNKTVNGELS